VLVEVDVEANLEAEDDKEEGPVDDVEFVNDGELEEVDRYFGFDVLDFSVGGVAIIIRKR
jgi:hypothetical protein